MKPVSIHEIVRAVRRALQQAEIWEPESDRPGAASPDGLAGEMLSVGPLTLNPKVGCLLIAEEDGRTREVFLTPSEEAVLACLMRSPGEVVTYQALAQEVWHLSPEPGLPRDMVRVVIHRLRRKVESDPPVSRADPHRLRQGVSPAASTAARSDGVMATVGRRWPVVMKL
ncbi:MAG: winged helix-turn-helix domain-containing protein [Anaerolineae bacterium]